MLFGTPVFVVGFLPVALAGFFLAASCAGRRGALVWIFIASLFFYAWWKPVFVALLIVSIGANFALGRVVAGNRPWLVAGLAFNLGLLAFFKYAGWLAHLCGAPWAGNFLPLGISFFTFQQIMFLVVRYRREIDAASFLDYACFIAFFPHLIAGPIVQPSHILPQLAALRPFAQWRERLAAGLEIFLLGLAKKLVLADSFARFANPGFAAAARHDPLTLIEAWVALLAYALQIYFDFSGYSGIM